MNKRIKSILENVLEDAKDIIAFSQSVGTLGHCSNLYSRIGRFHRKVI